MTPKFARSPVDPGTPITQHFSPTHHAIDFGGAFGSPCFACSPCVVVQVHETPEGDSGRFVIVRGTEGLLQGRAWSYSHLDSVNVRVGEELGSEDVVGRMGNSGLVRGSDPSSPHSGTHLHFAVMLFPGFHQIDPAPYLPEGT